MYILDAGNSGESASILQRLYYCVVSGWGVGIMLYTFMGLAFGVSVDVSVLMGTFVFSSLLFICFHDLIIKYLVFADAMTIPQHISNPKEKTQNFDHNEKDSFVN